MQRGRKRREWNGRERNKVKRGEKRREKGGEEELKGTGRIQRKGEMKQW